MAVLPEGYVVLSEMKIGDTEVGDPGVLLTKEQEELGQQFWKKLHLMLGKENALPPLTGGVIYNIDVGEAALIAQ